MLSLYSSNLHAKTINLAAQTIINQNETPYHPVFITGHSFVSNN